MKWITASNPSLEKLATAWLITRFVDQKTDILFVPETELDTWIKQTAAIPFEIDGVEFTGTAEWSAIDKIILSYRFTNPALDRLAGILRHADVEKIRKTLADAELSEALTRLEKEEKTDQDRLAQALTVFDALYAWCHSQQSLKLNLEPKSNMTKTY